jgi:hypothetical protein
MNRLIVALMLGTGVTAGVLGAPAALGQGNPPGTVILSSAVTGIQQFSGDLDHGGSVEWSSAAFSAGVMWQIVPAFAAGLSVRYDDQDWRIHSATAFGNTASWQRLERPGASANLSLALSRTFVLGASPTVEWAYASRAGTGDAVIYGAVFSAVKVVRPAFTLGGGASVTRQFYSVKTSPFVIVNWKLGDRFRIANAVPAGPLGGAGVELRYAPAARWEMAWGGVWRSDRWRLESPNGRTGNVGETSTIPLLYRLSYKPVQKVRVDLYAGASTSNTLTVKDPDGREIAREAYGVAPLVSATLSGRF